MLVGLLVLHEQVLLQVQLLPPKHLHSPHLGFVALAFVVLVDNNLVVVAGGQDNCNYVLLAQNAGLVVLVAEHEELLGRDVNMFFSPDW